MRLIINGNEAKEGQEVFTSRGSAILLDWSEPTPVNVGEVIIKEKGAKYAGCFCPCAIGAEFVD